MPEVLDVGESFPLVGREARAEPRGERRGHGDDDLVEHLARAVRRSSTSMPPPGAAAIRCTGARRRIDTPAAVEPLAEALEDRARSRRARSRTSPS